MRTPQERHIDAALSEVSIKYANSGFAAMQILPPVYVSKQSNKYYEFGKENLHRSMARRQNGTPSNRVSYTLSDSSYFCNEYALHDVVTGLDRNESDFGDPDVDSVEVLTEKLMLEYEYEVASMLTTSGNYTNSVSLTHEWDDYTNSTPQSDVSTAKTTIYAATLKEANTMVIPYATAQALALHPHVKDILKYTDPNTILRSGLPTVLWGLRVIEAGAGYASTKYGQTETLTALWGESVVIAHVAENPGPKTLSFGYSFANMPKGKPWQVASWAYPDGGEGGMKHEVFSRLDPVMTCETAGYLIENTQS